MKVQPVRPMTDEEAARLRNVSPDDPIPLPDQHVPCTLCGIATPTPPDRDAIEWVEVVTATDPLGRARAGERLAMTRCTECAAISTTAAQVVDAHPALLAALGDARAQSAVEAVLIGLTILGRDTSSFIRLSDRRVVAMHVRHLGTIGLGLRWDLRARPMRANLRPWAHVRASDRARLRTAYGNLLGERVALSAPPIPLPPPPIRTSLGPDDLAVPDGCLFCGVHAVPLPAAKVSRAGGAVRAAADLWTLRTVTAHSIGGRRSPGRLLGHLCPECDHAAEGEGLGLTAMERSLTAALGYGDVWRGSMSLDGLTGWGALVADAIRRDSTPPPPNREPWGHLDRDHLRDSLGTGTGLRPVG